MVTIESMDNQWAKQSKRTLSTVDFTNDLKPMIQIDDELHGLEKSAICHKRSRNVVNSSNITKLQINNNANSNLIQKLIPTKAIIASPAKEQAGDSSNIDAAAIKLQKVYKSYRTRRNLADCAVVVEELWWKALDFAALSRSSVSFFESDKSETAVSRWARARTMAAKVGKGLSKDEKAKKLALRHWLEAIDPRHRYGHNLHLYYDVWFSSESSQPFFYWLDVGDGKELNLENCPRSILHHQCIQYLGPKEREVYEVIVKDGKLVYRQSGMLLDTIEGCKWIFVLSTSRYMYVGQKRKGFFQHSSFLSGGATTAAGRLVAHNGVLEAIWPYSGHYHPTEENFMEFISFLEEHDVDLTNVKKCSVDEDDTSRENPEERNADSIRVAKISSSKSFSTDQLEEEENRKESENNCVKQVKMGEDQNAEARSKFESKKRANMNCMTRKWTTGTGPRIGCVREYPTKLQFQALEHVNLSLRNIHAQHFGTNINYNLPIPSPRPSPKFHLSPRLSCMGLSSPNLHHFPTSN